MTSLTLNPSVTRTLVELLSSDDAFRSLFVSDPMAALIKAGVSEEDAKNPKFAQVVKTCCQVEALASKETILEAKDQLTGMFTSGASQSVPMLDANLAGGRTLK